VITPARVNKPSVVTVKTRQQYKRNWRITDDQAMEVKNRVCTIFKKV